MSDDRTLAKDDRRRFKDKMEYWKTIEKVGLGEAFPLFDTARHSTQVRYSDGGRFGGIKSSIRLETGFFDTLNISITTAPYVRQRYSVITPFQRERGYPIDKDDLSGSSRMIKNSRMKRELADPIEGMYLFVFVAHEDMLFNDTNREVAALLHHLFLTLSFPNGSSFTARAFLNSERLFLLFTKFFPTDTGPLPAPAGATKALGGGGNYESSNGEQREDSSEGLDILLPFDLEKLKTISAKFLFLPGPD